MKQKIFLLKKKKTPFYFNYLIYISPIAFIIVRILINFKTKFSYKISCSLRLQTYLITFYWMWILTNPPLDYIFFLYPPCLQNFKKIKDQ